MLQQQKLPNAVTSLIYAFFCVLQSRGVELSMPNKIWGFLPFLAKKIWGFLPFWAKKIWGFLFLCYTIGKKQRSPAQ